LLGTGLGRSLQIRGIHETTRYPAPANDKLDSLSINCSCPNQRSSYINAGGGGITGDVLPGNAAPPPASVTRAEYVRIFQGLASEATARAIGGTVKVLVLPNALSPNPDFLTSTQKTDLLRVAESRLFQVEEGCRQAMPAGVNCQAIMIPLYTRTDALDPLMQDYFAQDWSVAFFLGGDPTAAMRVIEGTPVEPALGMLYQQGVIIAGVGGGANILSRSLLAGYQGESWNTGLAPGTAENLE
jgi:hypothetical protein